MNSINVLKNIINTFIGRVYGLLKDWDGKTPMKESDFPLLYEEMDDYSADIMQKLDDEIQAIKVSFFTFLKDLIISIERNREKISSC